MTRRVLGVFAACLASVGCGGGEQDRSLWLRVVEAIPGAATSAPQRATIGDESRPTEKRGDPCSSKAGSRSSTSRRAS